MADVNFRAVLLEQDGKATQASVKTMALDALPAADTLVKIDYSTLNYKDALAVTGTGKIVRSWPLVPGIDFAGTVVESSCPDLAAGMSVALTGWGVGEKYWGGYSQYQRVQGAWLVPLPNGMDSRQAMMIGTAGLEAMLAVMALEQQGVTPAAGPVLVTGAAGGVGSIAVAILLKLGYQVSALTRQASKHDFVRGLGAVTIEDDGRWQEPARALETQKWAAAIDNVGSKVLARILAETDYGGTVAACGLAGGADLPTTVMPFILRGVKLVGVDSVMAPLAQRQRAWQRLAQDLPQASLEQIITATVPLAGVIEAARMLMAGELRGRVLVDVNL